MSIPILIVGFMIMLSVYGGAHFYMARKIFRWAALLFPGINAAAFYGLYTFLATSYIFTFLSLMIGIIPIPFFIRNMLNKISAYWMGITIYLLFFIAAIDLIVLLGGLMKIVPSPVPQSVIFYKGLTAAIITFCVVCYGLYNANQIHTASYEIMLKNHALSNEINIVLISDLHLGAVNSERNLIRTVEAVNRLNPDIVCIAGDIFNDDINLIGDPSAVSALFRSINATYGVYACLGNHDGGNTLNEMMRLLEQSDITLLNEDYVIIDGRLVLVGRIDPSPIGGFGGMERKEFSEIIASADTALPVIVMEHNTSVTGQYGGEIDLLLSGHTHRGQIFPGRLITNALFIVDYGYYQKDGDSPHIVVTSGASTWGMPMRIGTHNEVVSIVMTGK